MRLLPTTPRCQMSHFHTHFGTTPSAADVSLRSPVSLHLFQIVTCNSIIASVPLTSTPPPRIKCARFHRRTLCLAGCGWAIPCSPRFGQGGGTCCCQFGCLELSRTFGFENEPRCRCLLKSSTSPSTRGPTLRTYAFALFLQCTIVTFRPGRNQRKR